jgi:thiamine pyrophosphate-dependent acetolactate synthase large subunit-like protein
MLTWSRLSRPTTKQRWRRGAKDSEHQQTIKALKEEALYGWDASPIATSHLGAELWEAIRNEDWSIGAIGSNNRPSWHRRLWDMTKHYHFTGPAGGGEGYGAPATARGAALANKKYGRLTVTIEGDGDLMYCPGVRVSSERPAPSPRSTARQALLAGSPGGFKPAAKTGSETATKTVETCRISRGL